MERKQIKKKKKTGVIAWVQSRPFTLLAFGLVVMTMVLIVQLPKKMGGLERQNEQLLQKMEEYRQKQAEYNVVQNELVRSSDPAYIEKLARRKHGFGWYGEMIYEIANLDEITAAQPSAAENAD